MINWLKLKKDKIGVIEVLIVITVFLVGVFKLTYTWFSILTLLFFLSYICLKLYLWGTEYPTKSKMIFYLCGVGTLTVLVHILLNLQPLP